MRLKVGQWVAWEAITRDRQILGRVVEASPDEVVCETREGGTVRRVTFNADAPWMPSPVRWTNRRGRRVWEYAR